MPPKPAIPTWELVGPYGAEQWVGQPGHYQKVSLNSQPVSLNPADGELHLLRARGSNCIHPGPWPFAFSFCPCCGTALQPAPPERETEIWSSPGNGASGQPSAMCRGMPDAARRADLPMPGPSKLDFFVAGLPSRLVAFDQTSGRVHEWKEGPSDVFEGGRWTDLTRLVLPVSLPRWSWSIAAFGDGAILPGDAGPVRISLLPQSTTTVSPKPTQGIQRSLGGAAAVGGNALVPVMTGNTLAVAFWSAPDQEWQRFAVDNLDATAATQIFAAPCVNNDEVFWVGEHGRLLARVVGGNRLLCDYAAWRDEWRPMRGVRPVLSPNGVFHQLGRLEKRQAFEALVPPGVTAQRREFDRYVISCGETTFHGMMRFREPWEPRRTEYRGDGDAFLLPLLAFESDRFLLASCSPRRALRGFIETDSEPETAVECRIMFTSGSIALTDLRATIRARSAWDIVPVVYRGTLLVYDLPSNRCFRWPLGNQSSQSG